MNIHVIGLNHKTAPVGVRERLAVEASELHPSLRRLQRDDLIREGVILSTCNRTELYLLPGTGLDRPIEAMQRLCRMKEVSFDTINDYLYEHKKLRAVEHCFRVAGSLDSMVLGESQILGQVKDAYRIAREGGFCDKFLHQLFQDSFRLAKKIRSQTNINRLPTSVGSSAVALAQQIFGDLDGRNVVIIGIGKMGRLCLEHLRDSGVQSVDVLNRTRERAEELAAEFGGEAGSLDEIPSFLRDAEIVITSTASDEPFIEHDLLAPVLRNRGSRPLFIIDIAVPRDVSSDVRALDNVYLYDIDDLEDVVQENLSYREQELNRAEELVDEGVKQFDEWLKTQDMGPMIRVLKQEVYQLVEGQLREHLLTPGSKIQKHDVQLAAHRITNKLLDDPLNVMKEKAIAGETDTLDMVQEMFNLDDEQIQSA